MEQMKEWCLPGTTIYSVRKTIYSNGRRSYIFLGIIDGKIEDITWWVARVIDKRRLKDGSISTTGDNDIIVAALALKLGYEHSSLSSRCL